MNNRYTLKIIISLIVFFPTFECMAKLNRDKVANEIKSTLLRTPNNNRKVIKEAYTTNKMYIKDYNNKLNNLKIDNIKVFNMKLETVDFSSEDRTENVHEPLGRPEPICNLSNNTYERKHKISRSNTEEIIVENETVISEDITITKSKGVSTSQTVPIVGTSVTVDFSDEKVTNHHKESRERFQEMHSKTKTVTQSSAITLPPFNAVLLQMTASKKKGYIFWERNLMINDDTIVRVQFTNGIKAFIEWSKLKDLLQKEPIFKIKGRIRVNYAFAEPTIWTIQMDENDQRTYCGGTAEHSRIRFCEGESSLFSTNKLCRIRK